MRGLLIPVVALLLVGCAPAGADGGGRAEPAAPTPAPTAEPQRYETTAVVLEGPDRGPELCLGSIAESYPPRCGGIPVRDWDWDAVSGAESASGTTWGLFHVVGTYDGTTFAVTEAGPPEDLDPPPVNLDSPCPEPEGGWPVPDPERASMEHLDAVRELVGQAPEFAGMWITYLGAPGGGSDAFVLNVAFTGNLEEHEAEVRTVWGGRLCVPRFERSLAELRRIQQDLHDGGAEEAGLRILGSGIPESENLVDATVVVADASAQAEIDRRYGEGAVRITPRLIPAGD